MSDEPGLFWRDLADDLRDPEFRRVYEAMSRTLAGGCVMNARWPDCATGWHDRCTQPTRCGCHCHTETSPRLDDRDDLFAAYVATYGPIAANDPVLLARVARNLQARADALTKPPDGPVR